MQACPTALLDQTPLIETVLFMQENKGHARMRTRTHTHSNYICATAAQKQMQCLNGTDYNIIKIFQFDFFYSCLNCLIIIKKENSLISTIISGRIYSEKVESNFNLRK